ncbi:hypothetical protein QTP70_025343 [Hemibagrus guttatus]|uniref:ODAD1 central coiled coil region domain-containing protein n=1 Tax=Hemibagrus guttatus TaxID=175788 RepID=A0AAE0Q3N5_9TELE|nr:hypothetical protein QTP70_025343 [Hemibagrus guttatus]KAK3536742.1 hypothetical protein QTP86_022985 [Hemibagrus guttatus]
MLMMMMMMMMMSELKEQRRADSEVAAETLEEVFQRIRKVTGEEDLETLVTKFIQAEDRNFALFNYVNEQNTKAEALKDEIRQIKEDMKKFQVEDLQQEQEHHTTLKQTEELQRDAEAQALEYEVQAKEITEALDQIKTGVNNLFNKIGCDRAAVDDLLGSSAGIRDSNIMTYLKLVEQKTNELLTVQAFVSSKVGCELEEKERFWSELDEVMESIPTGERVVIGADFNGHVGEGNTGDEEVMGKFGVKERNLEGQMVVDFAKRMDMGVVNTYFQKREEHRVTYKSGGRRTQDLEKDYDPKLVAQVLLGQSAEMQKQAPVVQPPVSGDDYDTEELLLPHEDNRPLTQEELRQRIMNRILQKEEALHAGKSKEARSAKLSALSSHRQSTLESTF